MGKNMSINQSNLPQFVGKLYSILDDPRYINYIRWGAEGTSFIIVDPTEFTNGVLAEHFKHSNMSSFVRQLNKYDFHKVKSEENTKMKFGTGMWEFAHKNFRKDRLDLIRLITRKRPSLEKINSNEEKNMEAHEENYNAMFQNYIVSTMSTVTRYFEMITEDITMLKKVLQDKVNVPEMPTFRALVVEDNASCSAYASMIIKRSGGIPVSVESVSEFNIAFKNGNFDFILISSLVPNVSDIILSIRNQKPKTFIILTTEHNDKKEDMLYKYPSLDKFLYKPYPHEELLGFLKKQLSILKTSNNEADRKGKNRFYA